MKDDTISRQDAINAICEDGTALERQGRYSLTMAERKQRDADILEALPSAQRWIPCKERLPKPEEEVLLTFDYKKRRYVETGNIWSDGTAHCYADDYLTPDGRKYRKVVAWMPLPEPYREDTP